MSYQPGFWEATAKPFAKTVLYVAIAGGLVTGAVSLVQAGCAYSDKADALAQQRRANTAKNDSCKSSISTRKGSESLDTKCNHADHVLRTKWERGELTVQCLCPNTIEDEKSRPKNEEGDTSDKNIGPEVEEKTEELEKEMDEEPSGIYL